MTGMRLRWPGISPLFSYDLVASTRRGQHAALRVLIASVLLFVIFFVYISFSHDYELLLHPFQPSRAMDGNELASFANTFASWCIIVQFLAVLMLTPSVVADAIAREKERRALDFLFVTDLTNREIVLGKLGARLAYLFGVLLTGLPILSLAQLWGGVDEVLLYGGYAALFATLLSLGSLSMLCSVSSRTSVQATVRAYAAGTALLTVSGCLLIPIFRGDSALPGVITYVVANLAFTVVSLFVCIRELRPWAEYLVTQPTELTPPVSVIQPQRRNLHARPAPVKAVAAVADDDEDLPFVLPASPDVGRAERTTPPAPPSEGGAGGVVRTAGPTSSPLTTNGWDPAVPWAHPGRLPVWDPAELPRVPLPPVDDERPLLWKEICLHSLSRGQSVANSPVLLILLLVCTLVFGVFMLMSMWEGSGELSATLLAASNTIVRIGTLTLGGLLGLGALLHTANSVSRERERDTLEGLLTLPVERHEILESKWLGGPASLRLLAITLGLVWVFGLLTGGIHPLALLRLALSVAAVVEFLASLGLWLSVVCLTSLRANMAAALCLLLVAAGPWIVANYVEMFTHYYPLRSEIGDVVIEALMAPLTWSKLTLTWAEYRALPEYRADFLLAGAMVYAGAAWVLWRAALSRFRRYGGRTRK
jgi:ABC-type transport system involved in multi-copper enzyme maturation permease subunit